MTLRSRLALGQLAIAIILVIPLLIAVRSLERLHQDARALRDGEFAASLLLGRLRESLSDLRRQETALLFVPDAATRDAMAGGVQTIALLTDSLVHYKLNESARDIRDAVANIRTWAPTEYRAALAERGARAESISVQHLVPALAQADLAVRDAERNLRERTTARVEGAATAIRQAERISLLALLLALAVAAGIAIWLTRAISRPVLELERGMRAVTDGELDYKLPLSQTRADEFGGLAKSFDEMTRQLTELDKLKAEFVSVASHELKTPINVIVGYLDLLDEGIYGELTEKQREIHRTLKTQTQSLARLVKQLLDVSRFEAGGGKIEPKRLELEKLTSELEQAFHVLALQRGVTFTVERREGVPATVVWDQDRMSEVLGNLLSNAFKFTERGGEVALTFEPVEGGVQIEVCDTGAGIPTEQLPHVFEKFYQADNQKASAQAGSGLGLAIAKHIVEAHRGTIHCESTPGIGTRFIMTLPTQVSGRRTSTPRAAAAGVA